MTTSLQFKTNLNCESCVAAVKPFLDDVPNIRDWEVDTATSDKILTVTGDSISLDSVTAAVAKAGFVATVTLAPSRVDLTRSPLQTLRKASRIIRSSCWGHFCLALSGLWNFDSEHLIQREPCRILWGHSFWRLPSSNFWIFADSQIPIVCTMSSLSDFPPTVSSTLSLNWRLVPAYIAGIQPTAVNLTTLVVMSVSSIGVIQSVFQKRKIRCACLGTVFNLPMSTVTLVEDGLMIAMAAGALLGMGH
jgi:copper chaperone CopZ